MPDPCVFCGAGTASREHVIARWMSQEVRQISPLRPPFGSGVVTAPPLPAKGRGWTSSLIDIVVRAPCSDCNGGWMSEIESQAQPVLTDLMWGRITSLDTAAQLAIATWAYKTALMVECAATPRRSWPRWLRDDMRDFYTERRPKQAAAIWLGRYELRVPDLVSRTSLKEIKATRSGRLFTGSLVPTTVCHALMAVARWDATERQRLEPRELGAPADSLFTIWPVTRTWVAWPPDVRFGDAELNRFG